MGFVDFSCPDFILGTIEELRELGVSLEGLVEESLEDVLWFVKLMGGHIILDHCTEPLTDGDILHYLESLTCE